ncbi:MAG TPA: fibronectin type III domain-containing protein, partial [Bacteroidota bacterium]|nr:fibronectin type III domain-containing protein [Bacteroidota bacterium]
MSFSTSIQRAALYLFASLLVTVGSLSGQTQFRIPLYVKDNTPKRDTLMFGVHPLASYCIDDPTLKFGDCDTIKEAELPPKPPLGVFDVRFVDSRSGAGACLGVGMGENIQGYGGPTDVDTFQVSFQPGAGGYPFTFRWPAGLSVFADSIIIRDAFGGFLVKANMLTSDSVQVTNVAITSLQVLLYHPKAPAYPGVPALTSPANNAVDVDTSVTLTWTASTNALNYVLQISESAAFNAFVLRDTLAGTSRAVNLLPNKTYYWRVSANHTFLTGCFSAASQFATVTTGPPAPTLVSPADGASNVALLPTLSWNAASTATSYRLEVSPNQGFTVLDFIDSTITGTSRQVGPLPYCVTRYWRVRAKNSTGTSPYSVVRTFTTLLAAPGVPALVSPADNAAGQSTTPTLSWSGADSCSKTYRLEVSTDSLFTGPLVFDNLTATSRPVGPLAELTLHFWRVRAKNQGTDTGTYSAVRRFTTLLNPPAAPTLSSPADGDTTVPPVPTLIWLGDAHVDTFQVQVAADAAFTSLLSDTSTTGTTYQPAPLANCSTFYWRVRGKNVSGTGPYSSRNFRVTRALSSAPTLLVPADGTINVDEVTILTWQAEACAFQYRVEVAADSLFTVMVADQTVSATSLTIGPLDGNTVHYWRVRGVNNLGQGTPSAPFMFRTTALTTPPKPVLISPADGQSNLPLPVTVCWDSSARAASYRLQLSIDSNFSVLTFNDTSGALSRCREFTFLLNSTTYYWRVSATN